MCNCVNIKVGTYANQEVLNAPKFMLPLKNGLGKIKKPFICVDKCLVDEVKLLWEKEIYTIGCCRGHNKLYGYIQVIDGDIKRMEAMGYEHVTEDKNAPNNAFIVKTKYK